MTLHVATPDAPLGTLSVTHYQKTGLWVIYTTHNKQRKPWSRHRTLGECQDELDRIDALRRLEAQRTPTLSPFVTARQAAINAFSRMIPPRRATL